MLASDKVRVARQMHQMSPSVEGRYRERKSRSSAELLHGGVMMRKVNLDGRVAPGGLDWVGDIVATGRIFAQSSIRTRPASMHFDTACTSGFDRHCLSGALRNLLVGSVMHGKLSCCRLVEAWRSTTRKGHRLHFSSCQPHH